MTEIGDVIRRDLIMLDCESTVADACRLMGEKHIGSVIITQNERPWAIFTERDLLSRVLMNDVDIKTAKIKDYASSPLVTITPDTKTREAARIMSDLKIKRLLVIENNQIIGIFTASDLADVLSKSPLDF